MCLRTHKAQDNPDPISRPQHFLRLLSKDAIDCCSSSRGEGVNKILLSILAAGLALFALVSYDPAGPTPSGLLNPNVTQANIKSTICVSGWTLDLPRRTRKT